MIKSVFALFVFILSFTSGYAQKGWTISGVIKDSKGVTLPGAGVYLSNYKTATVTDNDGRFVLNNLKPGSYDVLVQMMGFLPYTRNVLISDKNVEINIVLKDNTITLNEVVIQADPDRDKYINLFKEFFIGKTPNAAKCKLLNPQVLYVKFDRDENVLSVKSNEFLVIENKALGYRLKYLLQHFEYDYTSKIIYYSGLPNFEELKGSKSRKKKWLLNREAAYYGSSQHFFKSLYRNTSKEEGFIINKLTKIPNPNRPADTLINKNIKRFLKAQHGVIRLGSAYNDSLNLWYKIKAMPKSLNTLNRAEILTDTLVRQYYNDVKTMNFKDDLYVMYTKERETNDYTNFSGHSINRPLDVPNYEISVIHLLEGPVNFYASGGILESKSMLFEGFWAYEKIGDMVPMDYIPIANRKVE
jgi:hypothetical protein